MFKCKVEEHVQNDRLLLHPRNRLNASKFCSSLDEFAQRDLTILSNPWSLPNGHLGDDPKIPGEGLVLSSTNKVNKPGRPRGGEILVGLNILSSTFFLGKASCLLWNKLHEFTSICSSFLFFSFFSDFSFWVFVLDCPCAQLQAPWLISWNE